MFISFLFAFLFISKLNSISIKLFNNDNYNDNYNDKFINYNDFMKKHPMNRYKNLTFYKIPKYNIENNVFGQKIKYNSILQIPQYCIYVNPDNTDITNLDCGLRYISFIHIELPAIQ